MATQFLPKRLIDQIATPIILKNEAGVVLSCNDAYAKLHRVPINKILGFNSYNYFPKKVADLHTQADKDLLNSNDGFVQYPCHRKDGDPLGPPLVISKSILVINQSKFILVAVGSPPQANPPSEAKIHLTVREHEVLSLLMRGNSQKQIALALGVSHHTATEHTRNIYRKLGVHNRTQAQLKAITELGIGLA